jgi:hypothetical protein
MAQPDKVSIPKTTQKVPQLGHAGVLFIDGKTGVTKYYEYGRYDPPRNKGIVRRQSIPDAIISKGKPTHDSLKKVISRISMVSGQSGAVLAAYIELPAGSYKKMVEYAERRKLQNGNPNRVPYDLFKNSCLHFMKEVAEAGGVDMPGEVVPTPKLYMYQVRVSHPTLDYEKGMLTVPSLSGPGNGTVQRKAVGTR